MTAETAARRGSTIVALGSLAGLAWMLGATVSPTVALAAVFVVAGTVAAALWRRAFDAFADRRVREANPAAFAIPDLDNLP